MTDLDKQDFTALETSEMFYYFKIYTLESNEHFVCSSRVVLRCRQLARERFAKLRSDVLVKLELLDNKHGMIM